MIGNKFTFYSPIKLSLILLSLGKPSKVGAFIPLSKTTVTERSNIVAFRDSASRRRFVTEKANNFSSTGLKMGGYNNQIALGNKNFWNRETSTAGDFSGPVIKEARILALSDPDDENNEPLYENLPEGAKLVAVGSTLADFGDLEQLRKEHEPNVIFVSHPKSREVLVDLLEAFSTSVVWIHTRSAGIDFIASPGLLKYTTEINNIALTNAKGMFSSTLAEYTMMAISYFAKDLPRLLKQKQSKEWNKYPVEEIRGQTLGIIGYGDIGRATAKLAKAYGMKVVALRRKPKLSQLDPYCDVALGGESLHELMAQSDFVLVAAPLTDETRGMINAEALSHVKQNKTVLINVGRGPIINENDMIDALENSVLKGAALDVTTIEPLPETSRLWDLENVLLSPHNMDMTKTFMKESTEFFVNENLPRFLRGNDLWNPVDIGAGY